MLLCCRKSCCFKAVGDKAALQGASFPTLRVLVAGRRPAPQCAVAAAGWDSGKGEPWRWDAIAGLGASTSLQGKQSLPADAERWPSWHSFCTTRHCGLPPSAGDSLPVQRWRQKAKDLGETNKYSYARKAQVFTGGCVNARTSSRGSDKVLYGDSSQTGQAVLCERCAPSNWLLATLS